ncbi:MAG: HNH/ENDO VII family nuclease [Sedimentibacter sp.]|uniref:HNH/ENDO VII family nuclease n=1 Tax=Sedimentibacter sp. TaxID=1960295 RepID=UPI00298250B5|nr:HNH/ENDO VII family nuclease [Sedimentibacter sp.]MDW5299556.1 HNH/ENDO VII family nuclease [Sedimentibacter sp.]
MKRIIALLLSIVMLLTGCTQAQLQSQPTDTENNPVTESTESTSEPIVWEDVEPQYNSLDDELLLAHIEDLVYRDTVASINSDEYFVESVNAVYISKEYLEEVAFNSKSNIYFGYTLAELDELFQDTKYIFTLSENGTTTAQELQEIEDVSTETMLKNVAIGTGVILVCVTVSVVSAGAGAPAVCVIFAASATTAKTLAVSSAAFGGISAGTVRGIQTGDFNEAMEAAALGASEGFKWGAISGAIIGGSGEAFLLKSATKSGLTMNEAALIQVDSNLPIDVISQMHSLDEYLVYKNAGLKTIMVNGKTALIQNIDLNYISQLPDGTEVTNLVRMQKGYAPLDPASGKAYQLHHIGQKSDSTLAVLTESQHQGNSVILNIYGKESEIIRSEFATTRKEFWEYLGKSVFANGGI